MSEKKTQLFSEFPSVSTEAWEQKIEEGLKGKSYEKKLIWKTSEGFNVRPYYREEDLKNLKHLRYKPGEFPYVRGNKNDVNDWYIRQDITVTDYKKANAKAREILKKGATSLGFIIDKAAFVSESDFDALMEGIHIDAIELNFITGSGSFNILNLLKKKAEKDNISPENIVASFDYAPLGNVTTTGGFYADAEKDFGEIHNLIKASEGYDNITVLNIHGEHFHNSGASAVEELAMSLAQGEEYLTQLTENGQDVATIANKIKFNFAVGSVYFMEIAKLRAARMLWAKIVEAYNPDSVSCGKMNIHTVTSDWNKTIYDPYVNMVRTTTENMAAIIGGVESMTVSPYDKVFKTPGEFSERIARNQQVILKEEAHFDKVVDPAGGSYYIENLTASIAENAWHLFLEIQDNGGYIEAFKQEFIQDKIKESAQKRDMDIASRKKILLGTNQYPNTEEKLGDTISDSVVEPNGREKASNAIGEPLVPYRGAMKFEKMRYNTEKSGKRPKVFMLKVGHNATRTARAQFSANFFGCAGYEISDNLGYDTVEEGVKDARKENADVVVLCSSDEEYSEFAPKAKKELGDDAIFVVAGYPKDSIDQLKKAGIEHFIHIKSNLYETLQDFQKMLGVE